MTQSGQAPSAGDWVRPQVAAAWVRCLDEYSLELNATPFAAETGYAAEARDAARQAEIDDATHAMLVAMVYKLKLFLQDSDFSLVLADPAGFIVHVMGADQLQGGFGRRLLRVGVDWCEPSLGNNGIGSALVQHEAAAFSGKEHFYSALHHFTTAGCPILGIDGAVVAVLGAVAERGDCMQGLLCFLRFAVSQIESKLFEIRSNACVTLRLRPADISDDIGSHESLVDGLVAVSPSGLVIGANGTALHLLGVQKHAAILGRDIAAAIGVGLDTLKLHVLAGETEIEHLTASGKRLIIQCSGKFGPAGEFQPRRNRADAALPGMVAADSSPGASVAASVPFRDLVVETILQKAIDLQAARIPLLITGESGVGKDYLVRQLQERGCRKNGPIVAINCAAIPRDLIESELFGYEGGSFTGARAKGKPGKFMQADTGTLFLDEIGDMALDLQTRLLRVLDNSQVVPVGGTTPISVDVHVVAATNRNLQSCVRDGTFRKDLYYRLAGAQFWLPPLCERPDKMRLIQHVIDVEGRAMQAPERLQLSDEVWHFFQRYGWPGNIRELRNVVRAAIATARTHVIEMQDLPSLMFEDGETEPVAVAVEPLPDPPPAEILDLAEWEASAVRSALTATGGNISAAAKRLRITRATLYRKIRRYQVSGHVHQ
jgi:transcriptional regulator of acetoin/glycerol metabolism